MSGIWLLGVGSLIAGGVLALPPLARRLYKPPRPPLRRQPADLGLPFHILKLTGAHGKRLAAWFLPPRRGVPHPAPAVAMIHGWGGNRGHLLPLARLFHRAGMGVLLIDARNHGESEDDDFASMPRFAEDLEAGLDWLIRQDEVDPHRLAVVGHSVGAGAALLLAARRPDLSAVVSLAAFAHPGRTMRRQLTAKSIPWVPLGWLLLHYVQHAIGFRFDAIAPEKVIAEIRAPVLLVHGTDDQVVPVEDARTIWHNRSGDHVILLELPGVGHNTVRALEDHGARVVDFVRSALADPA